MIRSLYFFILLFSFTISDTLAQDTCAPSGLQRWSSRFSSSTGSVTISRGQSVLLDVSNVKLSGGITIESGGSLYLDTTKDVNLELQYILINGAFYIGSEGCPYQQRAVIQLTPSSRPFRLDGMDVGTKVIGVGKGGVIELHGSKGAGEGFSWTQLARTANAGDTQITLKDNVAGNDRRGWRVGDKIVISSTDFSPLQAEEVEIRRIVSDTVVVISSPLKFTHFGEVTFGVDERAEVALLSRNIIVRGSSGLGAHLIVHPGATRARLEAVEFEHVGQDEIGRYPVHFHMIGESTTSYVRYNAVHKSQFRCYVLHATSGISLTSNVAYDALGHCYYLEDGVEENNKLIGNLAINVWAKRSGERLGTDGMGAISSFWITNPKNEFVNNVAAGGDGAGFWIHVRSGPKGPSASESIYRGVNPSRLPMTSFSGNRAHSLDHGIQVESINLDSSDNPRQGGSPPVGWNPRNSGGKRVETTFDSFVAYKNRFRGVWIRLEDVHVVNGFFADNYEGVQVATSGAHPPATSVQVIDNCVFVGVSDNKGTRSSDRYQGWDSGARISYPLRGGGMVGWKIYDGTQLAQNSRFLNYPDASGGKYHSALGIRSANHAQMATTNFIAKSTFTNVVRKLYFADRSGDGGKVANLLDSDGSVSNYEGAFLLHNFGYYRTPNCVPGNSGWIACPHKYNQLWVIDTTRTSGRNRMTLTRNQHPGTRHSDYALTLSGFQDGGTWRYQPPVSLGGATYLMSFENGTPRNLAFQLNNAELGEYVQLMLCYPLQTSIRSVYVGTASRNGGNGLPSRNGASLMRAASSSTDGDVANGNRYFWDQERGILFVTVKQVHSRTDYGNFCPSEGCSFVMVEANVPTSPTSAAQCYNRAYQGPVSIQEETSHWLDAEFLSDGGSGGKSPNAPEVFDPTTRQTSNSTRFSLSTLLLIGIGLIIMQLQ